MLFISDYVRVLMLSHVRLILIVFLNVVSPTNRIRFILTAKTALILHLKQYYSETKTPKKLPLKIIKVLLIKPKNKLSSRQRKVNITIRFFKLTTYTFLFPVSDGFKEECYGSISHFAICASI